MPLASESITVLSTQISYYGIGCLFFDMFYIFLCVVGIFQAKKLWLYAATKADSRGEAIEYVWSFVLFIASTIFLILCLTNMPEDIMMTTAPLIWAIQQF